MQLALELLTQNIDGSPVRLDEVPADRVEGVINLYETLHIVHERVSADILIESVDFQAIACFIRYITPRYENTDCSLERTNNKLIIIFS